MSSIKLFFDKSSLNFSIKFIISFIATIFMITAYNKLLYAYNTSITCPGSSLTFNTNDNFRTEEFFANISDANFLQYGGNLGYIHADEAYQLGFSGLGVKVGVIDDSALLDPTHPEFNVKYANGNYYIEYPESYSITSENYHGIHVSGIIAAEKDQTGMHGVAFCSNVFTIATSAQVLALKEFSKSKYNDYMIINNSWGNKEITSLFVWYNMSSSKKQEYLNTIYDSVSAYDRDVLFVFSAGNHGKSSPLSPANLPSLIKGTVLFDGTKILPTVYNDTKFLNSWLSVMSFDPRYNTDSPLFLSSFTNLADGAFEYSVLAPGNRISSSMPYTVSDSGYAYASGTSMAAPHVSGVAALAKEAFPYMVGKFLADVILSTVTPITNYPKLVLLWETDNDTDRGKPVIYITQDRYNLFTNNSSNTLQYLTEDIIDLIYDRNKNQINRDDDLNDEDRDYFDEKMQDLLALGTDAHLADVHILGTEHYKALFGKGIVNAGNAVQGPASFDANRLAETDGYNPNPQATNYSTALYLIDVENYDSIWSNNINQIRNKDSKSKLYDLPVGLKKLGTGILTLAGQNTYRGDTLVAEGTLNLINDSSIDGNVSVWEGASLTGIGTFAGQGEIYGNLKPGGEEENYGVLTFSSGLVLKETAQVYFDFDSTFQGLSPIAGTDYDSITINTGTLFLDGVLHFNGSLAGDYTLFNYNSGIFNGSISTISSNMIIPNWQGDHILFVDQNEKKVVLRLSPDDRIYRTWIGSDNNENWSLTQGKWTDGQTFTNQPGNALTFTGQGDYIEIDGSEPMLFEKMIFDAAGIYSLTGTTGSLKISPIDSASGGTITVRDGSIVTVDIPILFDGHILNKDGNGYLLLGSIDNNYGYQNELFNVKAGTLAVYTLASSSNFLEGGLEIFQNASLQGAGTIHGPTTIRGTLAPGGLEVALTSLNKYQNLTFNNGLTITSTAVTKFDLLNDSQPGLTYDTIFISDGDFRLDGTIEINTKSTGTYTLFDSNWYVRNYVYNPKVIFTDSSFIYDLSLHESGYKVILTLFPSMSTTNLTWIGTGENSQWNFFNEAKWADNATYSHKPGNVINFTGIGEIVDIYPKIYAFESITFEVNDYFLGGWPVFKFLPSDLSKDKAIITVLGTNVRFAASIDAKDKIFVKKGPGSLLNLGYISANSIIVEEGYIEFLNKGDLTGDITSYGQLNLSYELPDAPDSGVHVLNNNIINYNWLNISTNYDALYAGTITNYGSLGLDYLSKSTITGQYNYNDDSSITFSGELIVNTSSIGGRIDTFGKLTFDQSFDGVFDGKIRGLGSVEKKGSGTITFTGDNFYGGGTTVTEGTLVVSAGSIYGTIVNNASLTFNQASDGTFTGAISGTGSLTKTGAGNLTLSWDNTYSGGTIITAGALIGNVRTLQGNILNNSSVIFDQGPDALMQNADGTYSGSISGSGSFTKTGTGKLTLTGTHVYSGSTVIQEGTLYLDDSNLSETESVTVVSDATLAGKGAINGETLIRGTLSPGGTQSDGYGLLTFENGLTLRPTAQSVFNFGGTQKAGITYDSVRVSSGALVLAGDLLIYAQSAGTYTLFNYGGASYGGNIATAFSSVSAQLNDTVAEGNLKNNTQKSLITFTFALEGQNNLTWDGNGDGGTWNDEDDGWENVAGKVLTFSGQGETVNVATSDSSPMTFDTLYFEASDYTLRGQDLEIDTGTSSRPYGTVNVNTGAEALIENDIIGSGQSLHKTGEGTLFLAGDNSYDGSTVVWAGTLVGNTGSLQGDIVNYAFVLFDQAGDGIYSGDLTGTGGLTKGGAGNLTLSGDNDFSGDSTVAEGRLIAGRDGAFGTGGYLIASWATLDLANTAQSLGGLDGQGTVDLGSGSLSLAIAENASDNFAGSITGTGGITKTGEGTLVLSGTNDYSGDTIITAGTLVGNTGSLKGDIENNASVVFDQAGDGIYSGDLTGTGGLTKEGAGRLTLSGENSFSGDSAVAEGTLVAGQAGAFGTGGYLIASGATLDLVNTAQSLGGLNGQGTVDLGSGSLSLAIAENESDNFEGSITGTGGITKTGGGTLILSGTNDYSGNTIITAGTLVGNTGSLKGDIENNAFVVFDQAGDGIYSGELTGTGGLTKVGDGSLTLSGENAFSGDSAVAGGTLIAGRNGAFGTGSYELSSTGKLDLNDHDQSIGALSGSGDIELGTGSLTLNQTINGLFEGNITGDGGLVKNGDGLLYLLGQNSYSGGTTINAGEVIGHSDSLSGDISVATAAALTFSQEDDGVFDGTLSGQGDLVKLGAGKLVFNNASDAIGSVTVEAGSFIVGESSLNSTATLTTDSIYVQSGALVGGHGTVEADVFILSGGSLSPGNSYGVNTIRGDLTLNPGAFFDVEVDPADENRGDKTIVQGTAYLTGAIVRHFGTGGVLEDYLNKQWTILTADSLDGTFYTAVSNLAFLAPSLNYTNTDVLLAFNAISGFSDSVVTNNQKAVAASLETLPPSSQLYQSVVSFATVQNVGAVMDQLSGEVFSSLTPGVRHVAALSNRVVVRHAFDLSNLAAARADAAPAAGLGDFANHRLWVSLGGSYGILNGSTDSAKMTISGAELSGGYDFNLANGWLGGLVLHFNDKKFNVVDRASDIDADTYGVSVYLGRNIDLSHGRLRLLLGGNWTRYNFKSERHVYLPAHQTLTANFNGDSYQVFFEAAYAKTLSWGGIIEPYASFGWTSFRIGGFREKGGSAAMISPSERQDNAFSIIGLRATAPLGQRFSIDVDLGWRHEFGSVSNKKYLAFAEGGNRFGVTGVSPNRDELLVGLRGNVSLNDNWKLGLQYNGNFGNNGQNHAGSLIISASW